VFEVMSIDVPGVTLLPDITTGAQAAATAINAAGGFGGRQVVIHSCNTMNSPAAATACAHKSLADNPIAEFGCETTWSSSGLPIYAAAKIPSFNCMNTEQDFHDPWSFGIGGGAVTQSKVGAPDSDFTAAILKQAGTAMNGAYDINEYASWGDTSNPQVAAYLQALKGTSADPTNSSTEQGYTNVEWYYTVAKQLGFANFNAQSLAKFMSTQTNVPIPLSRSLINPGPAQFPQQKQPYVQISQWNNGKMTVVQSGTQDGWVTGL
jgi:ABC-type branched-subunit amino acid transport system substrate-binding protein